MKKYLKEDWLLYLIFLAVAIVIAREIIPSKKPTEQITFQEKPLDYWIAPSLYSDVSTAGEQRKMVIYGQELITNTSKYFGPHGSVNQITNGMNCQNCHLDAGTFS